MALTNCKECGKEVSKKAETCPHCGAPVKQKPKQYGCGTLLLLGLVGLILVGIFNKNSEHQTQVQRAKENAQERTRIASLTPEQRAAEEKRKAEEAAAEQEREAQRLGLRWSYDESTDKMGRGKIRRAWINSINILTFDFPYQEPQRATLQLRVHPEHGKDVILSIDHGQFVCGIDECYVKVRFDNGPAKSYRVVEAADNSTNVVFFSNYKGFVANALKAKMVYIEAPFYQEGNQILEFNIAGLKW